MARQARSEGISVEFQPMSPEEMQRMMQFLLNQQARFDANSARFEVGMEKLSAKTDRIADGLIGLTGIVGQLAASQQRTDEQLRQQLKETDARLRETDARLSEHIETVESHLNVVVQMFERHLREDHGHPPA